MRTLAQFRVKFAIIYIYIYISIIFLGTHLYAEIKMSSQKNADIVSITKLLKFISLN